MKENATNPNPEYYGVSKVRIAAAALAQTANNMFLVIMMFAAYVATGGWGIGVVVMGYISAAMRMWDAVTDPIIAWFVPSVRSRFGVVRPVILLGYLLQIATLWLMFFGLAGTGNVVIFIVLYFVNILGYTLLTQGMSLAKNMLTNDPKKRPLIQRYNQTAMMIMTMFLSLYRANVLFPKHGGLNLGLFQDMAVFIIVVTTVFVGVGLFAIAPCDNVEEFERNYHGSTKFKLKDIWHLVVHNRAFLTFVISNATDKLASNAAGNTAINTLLFGVIIGNYAFSGEISIYTTIVSLCLIWLATGGAKKKGNKSAYLKWCWISIGTSALTLIFMLAVDATIISVSIVPTVIFVILYSMMSAFKSTTNACVLSMNLDIVDYEFYLNGKYLGPMVSSAAGILTKIFDSFSSIIVASCLALLGYVDTMPQQGDTMSSTVFWVVMFVWLGMPVLGYVASIIAMKWYPLSSEKMVEVQAANNERRANNAAKYEAELAAGKV